MRHGHAHDVGGYGAAVQVSYRRPIAALTAVPVSTGPFCLMIVDECLAAPDSRCVQDVGSMAHYKAAVLYGAWLVSVVDISTLGGALSMLAVAPERPRVATVYSCGCYACTPL
jgi:hypothetical protein